MIFWCYVMVMAISVIKCETNLLSNGDFEDTICREWFCIGQSNFEPSCALTSSTKARGGNYSIKVTGRTTERNGLAQRVDVTAGERYNITTYIQLLNTTDNANYQTVAIIERCTIAGKPVEETVAKTPYMEAGEWYEVGGIHKIAAGSEDCMYYVQTDAPADYIVDDASLSHISTSGYAVWESDTDARIDRHRKSNLSIELKVNGSFEEFTGVTIVLEQMKMEFVMGSIVSTKIGFGIHDISDIYDIDAIDDYDYTKQFYKNFEWGVVNPLTLEEIEDEDSPIIQVMNMMISKGIKIRCQNVLSGVEDENPNWVNYYSGTTLQDEVVEYVNEVLNHTEGMCEEWDIYNNFLHGDFYERKTGNPSFTADIFQAAKSLDDKPRLFLKDYEVISGPSATVAMKNIALKYKAANVPISGIGVQFHQEWPIDYQLLKERLDILSETGLRIMIIDFYVQEFDENVRAKKLTDLMTMLFSHPAVEGVVLKGFSGWYDNLESGTSLFTGAFDKILQANAAGRAYQVLFNSTWRTRDSQTLIGNNDIYNTRGFKGDYRLNVKYNGDLLDTYTFTLSDDSRNIYINVEEGLDHTPIVTTVE